MKRILLHTCCAPCATYTVNRLREQGFEVTGFWYNPNVHPFTEHRNRLQAMQSLAQAMDLPLIVSEGYEMIAYLRVVVGHEGDRCGDCFRLRLSKTAAVAREKGFSAFTTTLLISPYQKHELLRQIGEEVAEEQGVGFYYEDFRPGFRESHRLSKELNLYHQKYCGCLYSEWERYGKVKIAKILGTL
ncbi:MAG: epoxyqueuosine reductase QueH [Dehalococcoidia bacterium]|nr:MAG: epoxyqueuosine reductase QueH [Dehalococcoidia bacterium]